MKILFITMLLLLSSCSIRGGEQVVRGELVSVSVAKGFCTNYRYTIKTGASSTEDLIGVDKLDVELGDIVIVRMSIGSLSPVACGFKLDLLDRIR